MKTNVLQIVTAFTDIAESLVAIATLGFYRPVWTMAVLVWDTERTARSRSRQR